MRILYFTADFPYPLTSGHLRHYFLLRELARRHDVTLLSVVRPAFRDEHAAALTGLGVRVLPFASSTQGLARGRKLHNQLRAIVRRQPIELAALRMRDAVRELRTREHIDAAIVSGRRTWPVLDALHELPVVVDLCDADSVRLRSALRHTAAAELPVIALEYARVRRAERILMTRADHLLFASQRDRVALADAVTTHTSVVPNGVDAAYWKRTTSARGSNTVVFTGAMHYPPNADAALWLIRRVWPRVRRARPDAQLLIVGRNPPPRLHRAGNGHGIVVTGAVPDVRPYVDQATVFVAPIRFGAGIQNKVLEALAMEVPVVSSPLAAEGLRLESGESAPVCVTSSPEGFGDAILQHLTQHATSSAPYHAGRVFVTMNFSWSRSGDILERVLEDAAARAAAQRCVQSVQPTFLPG